MTSWRQTLSDVTRAEGLVSGVRFLRGLIQSAGENCDQELLATMIHFQSAAIVFELDVEAKKRSLKELDGDVKHLDRVQGEDDNFTRYHAHSGLLLCALEVGPHPDFRELVEPSLFLAKGAYSDPQEGPEFVEIASCFLYRAYLVNLALGRREEAKELLARIDEPYQSRDDYLLKLLVPFGVHPPIRDLES